MVGGVIEIQTAITKDLPVAVALKFTVHVVQSFIKRHRNFNKINSYVPCVFLFKVYGD